MANVRLWGATYSNVPAITVPAYPSGTATFTDTSPTTAVAADVASGKIFFDAQGNQQTGTASGGGGISIVDTQDSHGGTIRTITAETITSGTEGTPTATKGTVTNHSVSVTPSVTNTAGMIQGGTHTGTPVTVTASELVAGTILWCDDPGYWNVTDAETFVVAEGTAGTPTATKGTVNNHSVSVTPSVTNTAGWIAAGTKTGTAVSVSASELVSGDLAISTNGNNIDVTNYQTVSVNVAGSSKNFQISNSNGRVATTSYTSTGVTLTVAKTGTYNIYWSGFRSSTSGTNGSQLYIGNSAYGSAQTTFTDYRQSVKLSNISLTQNQVLTVYARARGTSYYMCVSNLTIEEV